MPERSFGRTIRYRRTKLGLSQAKLGELVGRSAGTIRAWEMETAVPNDEGVVTALSAVLGIDKRSLFEKAGLQVPVEETSPTMEEAFASLAAAPRPAAVHVDPEPDTALVEDSEPHIELDLDIEAATSAEPSDEPVQDLRSVEEPNPVREPESLDEAFNSSTRVASTQMTPMPAPALVSPPDPFVLAPATPPLVEPSYMEDTAQRQLYRVRNLATLVLLVALGIVLLWALSSTLDALGSWWEDFVGKLKL